MEFLSINKAKLATYAMTGNWLKKRDSNEQTTYIKLKVQEKKNWAAIVYNIKIIIKKVQIE